MTDMDDTIRVPLTEAEKAEMGERLAGMLAERDALEDQRKKAMDEHSKNRRALDDQIDELAEAIREGRQEKRQGDLFHEEKPAPAEVGPILANVAKRAGEGSAATDVADDIKGRRAKRKGKVVPIGRKKGGEAQA